MVAEGRKEGLCDLSNVVAFGHNELWRQKAATVTTKLGKISPNGNTDTYLPLNTTTGVHFLNTTDLWSKSKKCL